MQHFKQPFAHVVCDDFIDANTVRAINAEWPTEWQREDGVGQIKWNTTRLPPAAQAVVDTIDARDIGDILGIDGLFADPELGGAGLHCIPRGGFLKMHVDFNQHPTHSWHRRANVLIYLNEAWDDAWGGHLLLGDNREKSVAPLGGRCVMFETTESSWHGHPDPLQCPEDVQRRSLAIYFYTEGAPPAAPHSTIYKKK